ncbi:Agd3-related carbohydrate-binding protein [Kibdelosporangium aridum]|uniref:Agd3-related carbohydrate-binding protein n=1 Tax=Kibdelosporangium aridum TaxID=2030 RepID=UPI00068AC20F
MNPRRLGRNLPIPLLIIVALGLVAVTLSSPSGLGPTTSTATTADPVLPEQPPLPRKQRVPVLAKTVDTASIDSGPGTRVALRQLVVATDAEDFGLAAWKSVLDGIGTPYDVLLARTERLDAGRLVRPDGVGRYNAILLTNNALLYANNGSYHSAFATPQWNALWDYERQFQVRQVALNTFPGQTPEDYCLRPVREGAVGTQPEMASITGNRMFDYLKDDARIPITQSYLYRARLGCTAEPLLKVGDDIVGVISKAPDGRERAAVTFSLGPDAVSTKLLGPGLVRWATKGVFVGEQRYWFGVDVDDWFSSTLRMRADGTKDVYRLTGTEAAEVANQQKKARQNHPLAKDFTLNLPYNASKFHARARCGDDTAETLSSYTKCLADEFRWINHTSTHPQMNDTSYERSHTEIRRNLNDAAIGGLKVPHNILKTPEYSGLGVYNPDPLSPDPPTDYGLGGSNKEMLRAASDLGVRYVQGNMSFAGHRPSCSNCGIYHPLQPNVFVVPDWPTNIAFEAVTPEEQTALYNAEYGEHTYDAIVKGEAEVALGHVMSGSAYVHTLHQGNLHQYATGKSLAFDWIDAVLAGYSSYYRVPLKNTDWTTLANYVENRTAHFAQLTQDAIWNRVTNAVTYTPKNHGSLFITGIETREATEEDQKGPDEAEIYGSDAVSRVGVAAGQAVTLTASPRT